MIRRMNPIAYAVDAYLSAAGLAPESVRKYRDLLWKFADTVDQLELHQIDRQHCRTFLSRWATASESTRALHVTVLTRFFDFLVTEELLDRSPMDGIQRPRRKHPDDLDVVTITDSDVQRLIAACATWQEFLCISILVYLGVRRRAASRLRWRDIDLERRTARVREKGSKVLVKRIPPELLQILQAAEEDGVWLDGSDYVIPNRRPAKNRERSHKVIYDTVKKVASRARVTTHVHALRAAFAVRFDEQYPRDTIALKEWLGHSRIETTMVYLRRKDKAAAMDATSELSWGSGFPSSRLVPPAGFEPAFPPSGLPDPVRRKLDELSAGSRRARRRTSTS